MKSICWKGGDCGMSGRPLMEEGQGMVEYALILVLVFVVVLVVLVILGPSIGNMYSNVISNL